MIDVESEQQQLVPDLEPEAPEEKEVAERASRTATISSAQQWTRSFKNPAVSLHRLHIHYARKQYQKCKDAIDVLM